MQLKTGNKMENQEKKYIGRGGYHGGGRKPKGNESKTKTMSIVGTESEIDKIKEMAALTDCSISKFVIEEVMNFKEQKMNLKDFEKNEKGQVIVDNMYSFPNLPMNYVVEIKGEFYIIYNGGTLKPISKMYAEKVNKEVCPDHLFILNNLYKRSGFEVSLGRAITAEEFEEIKKQYHLTEDDITEPFDETKGEIYGEQNKKTFKAVQICVDNPIELERKLRDEKNIEAFSGSPGRIIIRIA